MIFRIIVHQIWMFIRSFFEYLSIYFRKLKYALVLGIMVLMSFLTASIYEDHIVHSIPIAVVDEDLSVLSRTMRLFFESNPSLSVVYSNTSLSEAEEALKRGEIASVVYFPKGSIVQLKSLKGAEVLIYEDGSNYIYARNLEKELQTILVMGSVGVQMKMLRKIGVPKSRQVALLMPVSLEGSNIFNPMLLYSNYLYPVLLLFFVYIFTILMSAVCFNQALPESCGAFGIFCILGRLASVFVVSFGLLLLTVYVVFPMQGLYYHSSFEDLCLLSLIFLGLTQLLVSVVHVLLYDVKIGALQICVLFGMMSVMVSGATFPLESMPWFMQVFAIHLPLTPFLAIIQVMLHLDVSLWKLGIQLDFFVSQAKLYFLIFGFAIVVRIIIYCISALVRKRRFSVVEG